MNPTIWGPYGWAFLNSIVLTYPNNPTNEDKNSMYIFLNSLGDVLPCKKCQINYKNNLVKYPVNNEVLNNKNNLTKWIIDIHNEVNKETNKKELTYQEALDSMKQQLDINNINNINKCNNNNNLKECFSMNQTTNWLLIIILIVILIIVIILIYFFLF